MVRHGYHLFAGTDPKYEIRNKSEYRNAENSKRVWIILVSDFGIVSYFDIRASNFTALFQRFSQRR